MTYQNPYLDSKPQTDEFPPINNQTMYQPETFVAAPVAHPHSLHLVRKNASLVRETGKWLMIASILAGMFTNIHSGIPFLLGFAAWLYGFLVMRNMNTNYQAPVTNQVYEDPSNANYQPQPEPEQGEYRSTPRQQARYVDGMPGVPPEQFL